MRHRATRTVGSRPCQDLPRCFLESKPFLYNRREQTKLATLLTQNIVRTRGANDDQCENGCLLNLGTCVTVCGQSPYKNSFNSAWEASSATNFLFLEI